MRDAMHAVQCIVWPCIRSRQPHSGRSLIERQKADGGNLASKLISEKEQAGTSKLKLLLLIIDWQWCLKKPLESE
jgi:hypothetical protein